MAPFTRICSIAFVGMMLLALVSVGCGESSDDERTSGSAAQKPATPKRGAAKAADAAPEQPAAASSEQPADGTLESADGRVIRSWGDKRVRRRVIAIFEKMQGDFRAGRMGAVCEHVDDFLLSQFTAGRAGPDAPCERKLFEYKRSLERRGVGPTELRLLWVRAYPIATGIWVEDSRRRRFRVPFKSLGDGRWLLELGTFSRPDTLNMDLTRGSG